MLRGRTERLESTKGGIEKRGLDQFSIRSIKSLLCCHFSRICFHILDGDSQLTAMHELL